MTMDRNQTRDFQKSKVYSWEQEYVAPHDKSEVKYEDIQSIVNYVWKNEGLIAPPKVIPLRRDSKYAGTGCRHALQFKRNVTVSTWIIIHEIAHAMANTHDDSERGRHGPDYVGIYMQLLDKYLQIPLCTSMYTASQSGVKYNIAARPFFLDDE